MLTSWNWLNEYVDLNLSHDELVDRLTMSGLNHDGSEKVGSDTAMDLEVTSNRADCLGHIGIAREISTLFDLKLNIPDPRPKTNSESIAKFCSVEIQNPDACYRYTARLIRGVKIGPSPKWMQERLATLGIGIVNNIVDVTNYVMFECGQPLHAFDFKKIDAGKIVVRNAKSNEKMTAIDHREYELSGNMCVIADAKSPIAIGGVMGGADSEVTLATTDVLIEAAYFEQLSVRSTARSLNLHSPSSFRFERDIDSAKLDWASRRCCQLILEFAGGVLLDGFIDVGVAPKKPEPIRLRFSQLERILGVQIPADFVPATLTSLGLTVDQSAAESVTVTPPSWRKDLTREIDLIEEVGRIFGYDKVPDDTAVPLAASHRPTADRVLDKVRSVLTAAGFDESVTASLVPQPWSDAFSPWTDSAPLRSSQPMLGVLEKSSQNIGAVDLLRRSLVPSLLEVRRINEYRSNDDAELFETSKVYLPQSNDQNQIPDQPTKLALVSGQDYYFIKGVVETLVNFVAPEAKLSLQPTDEPLLDISRSGRFEIGNGEKMKTLGWIGEVSQTARKQFGLRSSATVCELDLATLAQLAVLVPQHVNLSVFPPVSRDFNFIVDNSVHWADLESTVRTAGGPLIETVVYRETFRDEQKDGPTKKRLLLTVILRSADETLTGSVADDICQRVIHDCEKQHAASLS
jgi:phenylalanyl-tRNA synthetase beta chain